jgi:hypothetical protein
MSEGRLYLRKMHGNLETTHEAGQDARGRQSMNVNFRAGIAIVLSTLAPSMARGDTWMANGTMFNNQMSALYETFKVQNQQFFNTLNRSMQHGGGRTQALPDQAPPGAGGSAPLPAVSAPSAPGAPKPRHPVSATAFAPSDARLVPRRLAEVTAGAEEQTTQRQLYEQLLDLYEDEADKNGFPKHNAAYALAFLLGVSSQIVTGREVPDDAAEALARNLNDGLAEALGFTTLPAAKKQEIYETSVVLGMVIAAAAQTVETQAQGRQLASQVLAMFGGGAVPGSDTFADPSRGRTVAAADPATAPAAPSGASLQVESMYCRFTRQTGPIVEDFRFDFLVFYTNGLVYHGGAGSFTQGPNAIDLSAAHPSKVGLYKNVGDSVHISWYSGDAVVYPRERDRVGEWRRLPKVDGLRLQGAYVNRHSATPVWIQLAPDGTFRDQGVLGLVSTYFLEQGIIPPAGGVGTYTIKDYALTLRYADGLQASILLYVLPEDGLTSPRQLLLNTRFFERYPS